MVLAAIIDLKFFERQYRPLLTPGTTLQITSPEGHIYAQVARRRISLPVKDSTSPQGLPMIKKAGDYPLLVKVDQDKSTILSSWKTNTRISVILGVIVCLILLAMTWRTALYQRQQNQLKVEMYERSGIDPLTQLPNQNRAEAQAKLEIKKAIRTRSPLSVMLVDVDHFKSINESHGRQTGDEVLKGTAGILRECSRETDILSRYGSNHFMLLLPDTNLQGAVVLARKIHERLEKKSYPITKGEFRVTACFGLSEWGKGEREIQPTLQRATAALDDVKKSGRNNIRWMPSGLGDQKLEGSVVWLHAKDRTS